MKYAMLLLALFATKVSCAELELPEGLNVRYAVDQEKGWDFLILEIDEDRKSDFGEFDYVVYAPTGEKVAMTRVGFLRSFSEPELFVGRLLVNPSWNGQYSLVVTSRDERSGILRSKVYDARRLLHLLKGTS